MPQWKMNNDYILAFAVFIIAVVAILVIRIVMKRKNSGDWRKKQKKQAQMNIAIYRVLLKNRFTRGYITKLTKHLGLLSVYTREEIQNGVAKYTKKLFLLTTIVCILGCICFEDLITVLICVVGAYVYLSTSIEKTIEATTVVVYKQLKKAIASIRIEYKKCNSDVILALENAKYGNRIAPIMSDLKQILTRTNGEEALTEFYEKVPFKQIQTLAMICYNINNTGDEVDKDNNSVFDEAMLVMNNDINQKIEEINYERIRFGKLENLTLLGIILPIIIKYTMGYIMPATAVLYRSIAGMLIQDGILVCAIYAYHVVAHAHLQTLMVSDDRIGMITVLMSKSYVNKFVHTIVSVSKAKGKIKEKLRKSFSKKTVDDFYCERLLFSAITFCIVFGITLISPMLERNYVNNYTKSFSLMADNSMYEDKDGNIIYTKALILEMDSYYIGCRKAGWWELRDDVEMEEIKKMILTYMPKLTTINVEDQQTRLETKYQKLNSIKYHWWYIFIPIIFMVLAFFIPNRTLRQRINLAQEEEEEEFLQLQIIMMILASMNFDTLEALGYLGQIADVHREMLLYCYYGYASDPIAELEKMERQTQSENFKLFIGKLKDTVDALSIKEAFADLRSDRSHICSERDVHVKAMIDSRRARMGRLSLMPMNLSVWGMMVFPLVYTGVTGLMDAMSQLTAL